MRSSSAPGSTAGAAAGAGAGATTAAIGSAAPPRRGGPARPPVPVVGAPVPRARADGTPAGSLPRAPATVGAAAGVAVAGAGGTDAEGAGLAAGVATRGAAPATPSGDSGDVATAVAAAGSATAAVARGGSGRRVTNTATPSDNTPTAAITIAPCRPRGPVFAGCTTAAGTAAEGKTPEGHEVPLEAAGTTPAAERVVDTVPDSRSRRTCCRSSRIA